MKCLLVVLCLFLSACDHLSTDGGLLTVCWVGGRADYSGQCEELKWKKGKIPLTVSIDIPEKAYAKAVRDGYELWNDEVGTLFTFASPQTLADVLVDVGPVKGTATMSTSHAGNTDTGPTSVAHVVRQTGGLFQVFCDAAQEAGHVLGLAHDDTGLMSFQYDCSEIHTVVPWDSDVNRLRSLYLE
jgi:hypothetical protein